MLAASIGFTFALFMFFWGYDYWLHKLNYKTFTGVIEASYLPATFEAFDQQTNFIVDKDFNSKIVLLDFWNTRCGTCFEKFPQVQSAHEKYKNDSAVIILAVNKPIQEDKPDQAFQMIKEKGYSFPVVITKDEDLAEKFGVNVYPTTLVINQNKQIVYRGNIEGAVKMIEQLKLNSR